MAECIQTQAEILALDKQLREAEASIYGKSFVLEELEMLELTETAAKPIEGAKIVKSHECVTLNDYQI